MNIFKRYFLKLKVFLFLRRMKRGVKLADFLQKYGTKVVWGEIYGVDDRDHLDAFQRGCKAALEIWPEERKTNEDF